MAMEDTLLIVQFKIGLGENGKSSPKYPHSMIVNAAAFEYMEKKISDFIKIRNPDIKYKIGDVVEICFQDFVDAVGNGYYQLYIKCVNEIIKSTNSCDLVPGGYTGVVYIRFKQDSLELKNISSKRS